MKQFLCMFLVGILLLGVCSCTATTPKTVVAKGQPYTWTEGNVITVTQTEVNNGEVRVELKVDFSTAKPEDLKQMTIRKTNGEEPELVCERIFMQQNYVYLVFQTATIKGNKDLEQYVLTVPIGKDNHGTLVMKDAMALS